MNIKLATPLRSILSTLILSTLTVTTFAVPAAELKFSAQQIAAVGSHAGQTMYFSLQSTVLVDNQCAYGFVYCPITQPECEAMLSIVLSAKVTQSKSVDIDVNKGADNICTLYNVRF